MIQIGRIVLLLGEESNGSNEQPAVITRILGKGDPENSVYVNVMVLPDAGIVHSATSVLLFSNREGAEQFQKAGSPHLPVPICAVYIEY